MKDTTGEATSHNEISDVRMTPALKAEWVAALRSGEYKKTTGELRGETRAGAARFCCLGVLGCLLEKKGITAWNDNALEYKDRANMELLPSNLAEALGLSHDEEILAALNDGGGGKPRKSFRQIADWIDKNVKVPA